MADTATGLVYMKQGLYIRALIEFEDPAKAGDPVAEANLGAIYYYGLGVSANFAKAAQYYHAAALKGKSRRPARPRRDLHHRPGRPAQFPPRAHVAQRRRRGHAAEPRPNPGH